MADPWKFAIALLAGAYAAPAIAWPVERTWIVVAPWPQEPDLELPPELAEPAPLTESEAAILEHLVDAGAASVRQVAAAVALPRSNVCRGLHRLRDRGRVRLAADGWSATSSAQ